MTLLVPFEINEIEIEIRSINHLQDVFNFDIPPHSLNSGICVRARPKLPREEEGKEGIKPPIPELGDLLLSSEFVNEKKKMRRKKMR